MLLAGHTAGLGYVQRSQLGTLFGKPLLVSIKCCMAGNRSLYPTVLDPGRRRFNLTQSSPSPERTWMFTVSQRIRFVHLSGAPVPVSKSRRPCSGSAGSRS